MRKKIEAHFILIIITFAVCALIVPGPFVTLKPLIPVMLAIIIFGIGCTVELHEFKQVYARRNSVLFVGLFRSFLLAPLAYLIGLLFHVPVLSLIGLVIVGACPGGTAANVTSYLSKGNIALTVILTFFTTLVSPLIMPSLIYFFLHQRITVPYWGPLQTTFLVVFFPLIAGMLAKFFFPEPLKKISHWLPLISILLIVLAIACIMALVSPQLKALPQKMILAVLLLNLSGYLGGWVLAKLMKYSIAETKSLCFEYGIFDVGIGIVIATLFFAPEAALPSALMAIIQNITASCLVRGIKPSSAFLYCRVG